MGPPNSSTPRSGVGIMLFGRVYMLTTGVAIAVAIGVLAAVVAGVAWFAREDPAGLRAALLSPLWISLALWIAMSIFWSRASRRTAPIRSGESAASRSRHQLLLNAALLLVFLPVPLLRRRWLPEAWWPPAIGLGVQAAAILLDLWAMRCLGRNWSGKVAIKVDHALVTTGPYRLVRHPIYTAMGGMYLGSAIVSGEVHALAGVALAAIAYVRKTLLEERGLRETFGQAYDAYARGTWVVIPWVL